MGTHQKRITEALLMSTNNVCFLPEIRRILLLFGQKSILSGAVHGTMYLELCQHFRRWGTTVSATTSTTSTRNNNSQAYRTMQRAVHVNRGRRSGVIVGTRPLVPASVVPEELISQCQVVLQGKSRNLIIRELQRTVSEFCHYPLVSLSSSLLSLFPLSW